MAQSISSLVASALSSFSRKLEAQPTFREATVTATDPLMVQFDTDTSPSPALCSLDIALSQTDRVLTMTLNGFLWVLGRKNGNAGTPGTYDWTAAPTPPPGGLLCNGQAVSRVDYARLFSIIGTTYGNGDGTTTFNVPNAQGRTLVHLASSGQFSPLGAKPGAETHTLTASQIPNLTAASAGGHNHGGSTGNASVDADFATNLASTNPAGSARVARAGTTNQANNPIQSSSHSHNISTDGAHTHVVNAGGGGSHNNVQPSFVANLFIWT